MNTTRIKLYALKRLGDFLRSVGLLLILIFAFAGTSYADTNISSCTLFNTTGTYLLTADIINKNPASGYCMDINSNGITIDCQGYTVDGLNTTVANGARNWQGAGTTGFNNTIIKNCKFTDWDRGFWGIQGNNLTIQNTTYINVRSAIRNTGASSNTTIKDVFIYNLGNASVATSYGLDLATGGITSANIQNVRIENGSYADSQAFGAQGLQGTVTNLTVKNMTTAVVFGTSTLIANITIYNSTFSNMWAGSYPEFRQNVAGELYLVNVSYNTSSMQFLDNGTAFALEYIRLNFTNGSAAVTVNYTANDSIHGTVGSGNSISLTSFFIVNATRQNKTLNTTYYPITINATKNGGHFENNVTTINLYPARGVSQTYNITIYTAPTVGSVTLCNGTACSALGTLYYHSNALNASGNCSGFGTGTGYFTFYRNGTAYGVQTITSWNGDAIRYANTLIASTALVKSDTWRVGLICNGGGANSSEAYSTYYTVNNTAPTLGAPTLNDSSPPQNGALLCTVTGYADIDGDPAGTAYYRWWKNGTVIAGQTASTLSLTTAGAAGSDRINCSTIQSDSGYSIKNSTETFSLQAVVKGAPTVSAVELTKQPACSSLGSPVYAGIVLTCKATPSDPDSNPLNVTYAFYRNSTHYQNTTVNGVTANASYCSYNEISISDTVIKKSDTWYCSVRAFDGLQYSAWANSTGATINNTAPVIGAPTINNTSPITSSILLCNNGSFYDFNGDAANNTYYKWYKNNVLIAGNTSSTLNLTTAGAAYGDTINCSMIRSDSGYDMKNSSENFSTSVKVQSPPWTTSTTICAGALCTPLSTIYVDTSLNCSAFVYDNDTATIQELRFNWNLNGTTDHTRYSYNVDNNTLQYQSGSLWANPLPGMFFGKSDTIYCESRAYDGLYYSAYNKSAYYTVNNSAPTISPPTLSSYTPGNSSVLTCTGAIGYADADGDALNVTSYKWWKNGVNLSATTNSINLITVNASDGDVIYCENWVSDSGYDMRNSTRYNSSPATVGIITAPQITNCSTGFSVLNFFVLDEQTFAPIISTMEATFTLYNITGGAELSNVSFFIQNRTNFSYCINPYAALTLVNSYQTYYPFTGTAYAQRNYYLFNSTLDASAPQNINVYLLNSSASTDYTFQVVNQYSVPLSGVKLTMQRFMPTLNAWVVIEQQITDFSGYSMFNLQAGTLYRLLATANGYVSLSTDFTPGAVTSIQIRLTQTSGVLTPVPNYEQVFNDVTYKILPTVYFHNASTYAEFEVSSASSSLTNYSMVITRRYNGTTAIVFNTNVTSSPAGGILNYTATLPGEYTLQISFKHANYTQFTPVPTTFFIGNSSGASLAIDVFATGFMNGWAFYFIALVCAMLAAGFALRFSPEASGAVGLLVLWCFTYLYPVGVIVTVAGVGITVLMATILTSLMVGAVMFLKWYV
jgi:hypothetical protein